MFNSFKKRNAMKKLLILAAAVFALGTSTVSADNDRPISVSELPEKAQQFIRQHFPNEKVSFAKMERELFDTTYELQGRIPEKRRLERGRLQIFDGSCRDHPSADRAVRFPVLSRYVRRPDRPRQTGLRGEAHQRVGVDVRPEIQPDRHRRLTLSDGSSGDRPKMKAAPGATHCARGGLFVACR